MRKRANSIIYSDERLLESCRRGDEKAWQDFVERFAPLILWAIRNKIVKEFEKADRCDIEDIFQQAMVRVWQDKRLQGLKSPRSLSTWLVIVAQSAASDFIRKRRSEHRLDTSERLTGKLIPQPSNPRTETEKKQMYETVEELVAELPLKERRIMTLELFYDFKQKEIAGIMGMPLNTVSTIVSRIKKSLTTRLKSRGYNV